MGKKTKKPGKGKEKTEKKTAKAEEKRARRESKKLSPEDDIDAILLSIQKEEAKKKEVHIDENVPAPSPRSNCTLSINPLKETELILYGGEFYNGSKTFVYGDLYRYDVDKMQWKLVSSPNSPPPRSAHQAVAWKNYLYIFGGEFTSPNQERFHHYKVLYKHKIIVFGGFYDTLREVRYHNDLYVFDLDDFKWQEIKPKLGSMWPGARSGFQFFVYQDQIFLYGGYSKEVSSDKNGSEKGIVHSDMWCLDPRTWEWNKVKKSGMPPGPRAGFSMCVHKKRALLFGGVVDMEMQGDVMMSLFMNELYGFQLDNNRWYPLELRKEKSTKAKLKKDSQQQPESSDFNDKINAFEAEPSSTNDKYQISEYDEDEEAGDEESNIDEMSQQMVTDMTIDDGGSTKSSTKPQKSKSVSSFQNSVLLEIVKPCGRINSCMVVGKDTLYIYGGMMEVKDQEITLDDLYSLNLSKLDEWKCIIPAKNDGARSLQTGDAVALIRGEGKNLRRKEKRARIEQIRANLGLSDSQRTPMPGESLRDFYRRTSLYWQMAAHEHTQHTGKELRKDGFDLADSRYRELKPLLDESFEESASARTLKQDTHHAHEVHCSRERSRAAWQILEDYLMPFVEEEGYQISTKCSLHPDNDLFRDQEQHKISVDINEWRCGYCKKSFRAEKFLDQHFDNRHYNLLNVNQSKCLADLCGALHCDFVMNSKSLKAKCNPAAVARNRHLCEIFFCTNFVMLTLALAKENPSLKEASFIGSEASEFTLYGFVNSDVDATSSFLCSLLFVSKRNEEWNPSAKASAKSWTENKTLIVGMMTKIISLKFDLTCQKLLQHIRIIKRMHSHSCVSLEIGTHCMMPMSVLNLDSDFGFDYDSKRIREILIK
ncbi:Kelch repeat type 2 [Corchorus olitorius]|uniref:Kelch repeat type 2 n=1 Tax=Corchorus olitorius TaxID=93759 RepID=A0A1R3KCP8_9ROSI|nr:Kelch repeat type 2 [Corchorus olitorius]